MLSFDHHARKTDSLYISLLFILLNSRIGICESQFKQILEAEIPEIEKV
jgi:hypothetical protein